MKCISLLTLILLAQVSIHAQTNITFPDVNFKQALLDYNPKIDTNNDGQISNTEAVNVTGTLDVRSKNIGNMSGIEHFTSLEKLYCSSNSLNNLDVSALTNLKDLRCSYNNLNSLDVSALTNLETLNCRNNNLTSMDLRGLTKLKWFSCENNIVTNLILGGQTNMTQLVFAYNNLTSLDLRNISLEKIHAAANRCLQCVIVDDINDVPQDVSGGSTPIPYTEVPCKLPVITCKNYTVRLDVSGTAFISGANVLSGRSSDVCGFSSMSVSPSSFTCADVGENQVTLTVNDVYGNTNTCTAIVTVEDNVKPNVKCQNVTVQLDASGNASISTSDINNGSTDACGIESMSVSPSSFTCTDVGENQVILTVKDKHGNKNTCTATVTVEDTKDPTAICKNITVKLDASGNASISASEINNRSSDDCGIESMSVSPSSFTCADVGEKEVTLTVRDKGGNESTCTTRVTVEDNVNPDAKCQDITVQLDASGKASISTSDVDNGSSDACGIESMSVSPASFTCADVGENQVILTVKDKYGNTNTCTATVNVEDNVKPNANCQNITVQLDASGNTAIAASDVNNGSSDACGIESMRVSPSTFTVVNLGENEVTLTIIDKSGNESTCTAKVTVEDNVKPDAKCQDITLQLDASGNASISVSDLDNGSSDASGIKSMSVSSSSFTCADLGDNAIILTVTDVNGNSSSCTATVTVEDQIKPVVHTRNQSIFLDKSGQATITPSMIDDGSSDNCTITSMWLEGQTEFDCGSIGEHEVVLKARDQSGHTAQGRAIVTVKFYKPDFESMLGIADGDTLHQANCQVPREVTLPDQDLATIRKHGQLRTTVSKVDLPDNAPWSQYAVWRTEYVMKDACAHTYRFSFYQALYDLAPPVFQFFPSDTTVATSADVPDVDPDVKIIDVCQYVVWDTVVTLPVLDRETDDTIGFTRRWIARDPSGHESFRDQMIWVGQYDPSQFSRISGRIGDENQALNARFSGEAGMNGIPVSLYRIDEPTGSRIKISDWVTGDWMGSCGTYYFVPVLPGRYQVKIDSMICLVDTIKFDHEGWSDTLELSPGESVNQGWVFTQSCPETEQVYANSGYNGSDFDLKSSLTDQNTSFSSDNETSWNLFPNPSSGYLRIKTGHEEQLEYRIYNTMGQMVKSGIYQHKGTINIHEFPSGVYHVQLYSETTGNRAVKKVLLME